MGVKPIMTMVAIWIAVTMTGCNTIRGIGKDIHDSAQAVQDALEYETGVRTAQDW